MQKSVSNGKYSYSLVKVAPALHQIRVKVAPAVHQIVTAATTTIEVAKYKKQ